MGYSGLGRHFSETVQIGSMIKENEHADKQMAGRSDGRASRQMNMRRRHDGYL